MALTVTDGLNALNDAGFFSYVIPFLLIFAVVFAVLKKTNIFGEEKPIITIVSAAIGLLALQFDMVSIFFANIFPKFGVGLAILLVVLIFLAFAGVDVGGDKSKIKSMGWVVGIGVVLWALINWGTWFSYGYGFGWWIEEYIWSIIILGVVIGAIFWVSGSGNGPSGGKKSGGGSS